MREFVRIFDDCFNSLVIANFECFSDDGGYLTYYFPDSLTNGQFHSILTHVFEKSTDSLVVGEPSGCGKYIVLQKHNGRMGNLCGEVPGLAFPQSEILLAVFKNHLYRPTHGVNLISFVEVKICVCGKHSAPWGTFAAAHIKQTHGHVIDESVHYNIVAAMFTTVLHALGFGGTLGYDCLGRNLVTILLKGKPHAFLSHLYHAEIVAFNASGLDEAYNVFAGEPTVSKQIIKTVSVFYGSPDHILEEFDFTSGVVLHALCRRTFLITRFLKTTFKLGVGHGMITLLARLSDKFKIKDLLTLTITDGEHLRLESQHHLVGHMAEDTANLFGVQSSLWVIRIIDNEAHGVAGVVGANRNLAPELAGYVVHDFTPVKTVIIDEPVEHILRCAA